MGHTTILYSILLFLTLYYNKIFIFLTLTCFELFLEEYLIYLLISTALRPLFLEIISNNIFIPAIYTAIYKLPFIPPYLLFHFQLFIKRSSYRFPLISKVGFEVHILNTHLYLLFLPQFLINPHL